MLRRFESIKNCGIFEDYRWDSGVPDFERINLIFGSNGSGKTSLARALEDLGASGVGYVNVSIRMSDQDKASHNRASGHQLDAELGRVYVFSDRYVDDSHDFSGDTEIEVVLTLGKRTVEDEKRVAELRGLVDAEEKNLEAAKKSDRNAAKALEDDYTAVARGVVNTLQRAQGEYRSNGSYSAAVAKRRFEGSHSTWALLADATKTADLATINSDERQKVADQTHSFAVRQELRQEVLDALVETPVAVVLDTLQQHPDATSWVEDGRHHHEGSSECIYCGGALSDERKKQIEQHFSDEVERVQQTVDALIREVKDAQNDLRGLLGDGTIAASLFEDLRDAYKSAHETATKQSTELTAWLSGVQVSLETKRSNVVKRNDSKVAQPPAVDGSNIDTALASHNDRVDKHADLVQKAAKRVEHHLLKDSEARVNGLAEAAKKAAEVKLATGETLRKYREEIAALESVEGDPLPSAETMSRELTRILGRNELAFTLLPDGKHYRVTRNGAPARDLSAGERTAITLIHFLEHVKQVDASAGKPIVVIDDPVSSLDSGASIGISTYIWSEAVSKHHIEQIFLMTHNFELFRQWDIQIDGLPGKRGAASKDFPSNCYELIAPHRDVHGVRKRVPAFATWPPNEMTRRKVRSSYHHAFIRAAHAHKELLMNDSMEHKLDAMLLYPNVLRRVLETFLAFKSPTSVGNFTHAMRDMGARLEVLGYTGDADALRLQLTRFTHSSSHAESPETDVAVNPDEIGAIIAAAFTFMDAVDREHFQGLCEVVGLQPGDLLVIAQPVTEVAVDLGAGDSSSSSDLADGQPATA